MRILAAVSGGMDSMAALLYCLQQGHDVTVFHVILRNATSRWRAEADALACALPWLQAHGYVFGYAERERHSRTYDIVDVTASAAEAVKGGQVPMPDVFVRGATAHDSARDDVLIRREKAQDAWNAVLGHGAPPILLPTKDWTRPVIWQFLPPELRILTSSCRTPANRGGLWQACGHCHACRELDLHKVPRERAVPVRGDIMRLRGKSRGRRDVVPTYAAELRAGRVAVIDNTGSALRSYDPRMKVT